MKFYDYVFSLKMSPFDNGNGVDSDKLRTSPKGERPKGTRLPSTAITVSSDACSLNFRSVFWKVSLEGFTPDSPTLIYNWLFSKLLPSVRNN